MDDRRSKRGRWHVRGDFPADTARNGSPAAAAVRGYGPHPIRPVQPGQAAPAAAPAASACSEDRSKEHASSPESLAEPERTSVHCSPATRSPRRARRSRLAPRQAQAEPRPEERGPLPASEASKAGRKASSWFFECWSQSAFTSEIGLITTLARSETACKEKAERPNGKFVGVDALAHGQNLPIGLPTRCTAYRPERKTIGSDHGNNSASGLGK